MREAFLATSRTTPTLLPGDHRRVGLPTGRFKPTTSKDPSIGGLSKYAGVYTATAQGRKPKRLFPVGGNRNLTGR